MTKTNLSKRAAAYMKRIETCTSRYEIEGIRIEFSQDCSAYRLSWSEFTILLQAQQAKRAELRGEK